MVSKVRIIYMETDRSIGEGEAGAIYFGEALADESADEDDTPLNSERE